MRSLLKRRHLLFAGAAVLSLAAAPQAAGQVVERTDTPAKGFLRVSLLPQLVWWDTRDPADPMPLGADLTTDTLGARQIPSLGPAQTTIRQIAATPGYVMTFGASTLTVQAHHRALPIALEVGVTDRLAVGVTVPLIRTELRAALRLDTTTATVGWNPTLAGTAGGDSIYTKFFTELDTTLARLQANITAGTTTCPGQELAVAARAAQLRDGLKAIVLGQGGTQSPVLPRLGSSGGVALDTTVDAIQRDFTTCGVSGFSEPILLPTAPLEALGFQSTLLDSTFGFNAYPLAGVRRWALGDIELHAKYRYLDGPAVRGAAIAVLRLPTGAVDHANDFLDVSPADRQTDLEVRLINEWTPGAGVILHGALRAGRQFPQTLVRRVTPFGAPIASAGFETEIRRDPGDYLELLLAPMIELAPGFTAGMGGRYRRRDPDRHTYATPGDSLLVAQRTGVPVSASVLDVATWEREYRVSAGVTYTTPKVQGAFAYEVTFNGGGGRTPVARRFLLSLRTSRRLF